MNQPPATSSPRNPDPGAGSPLLTPLRVGALELPNRIVFGAHVTNFGADNRFGERHLAYYAARAEGGAGLIVTEALTVHPLDWPYEHVPFGHRDGIVPSLAALAGAVRGAGTGTRLFAQLNHSGGQSNGKLLRQSPWAPSPVPEVASRRVPREMDAGEIAAVVEGFAQAAVRCARAGLDGVELHAGQQALLRQFLSPLTNQRADDYGGPLENRARLTLETVRAVRRALGPERVLGLKLCGDELAPWGGLTPEDAAAVARLLVEAGGLDYLSVQIGGPYSAHLTEAAMPTPQAHAAHLAQAVREAIGAALPVFAEGRIESPRVAQDVLAAGQADAAVMTRALISDPALPRKIAGLDDEPLRPHIGMTRYFSVQGDWNRPLGDLSNPRAGRERLLPPVLVGKAPRPALVMGGGPAGMEAAITLARQGRPVTLREGGPELGGMAAVLARAVPARAEFALLVDYQRTLLERLRVRVELGQPVTAWEPAFGDYETLYLAIGAEPPPLTLPGGNLPLLSPRALLTGAQAPPPPAEGPVAVVDDEGGFRMAAAVEWLLERGYGVDVLTPDFFVGRGLVESAELLWFQRVAPQGARFHPRTLAVRGEEVSLRCRERFSGREFTLGPLAAVVLSQPEVPAGDREWASPGLAAALRATHPRVVTLGDARAPRLMGEAILHAHRTVLVE